MHILIGIISSLVFALNTIFWCLPLYVLLALRTLAPTRFKDFFSRGMVGVAERWIAGNSSGLELVHYIDWDVEIWADLRPDRSYLVCSNHLSWTDIVVLQKLFNRKIPFLRFFIKSQLVYVPLLGLAWLALDFPRMKRHSKTYLEKHPEKRGEDLEMTRRICARFRGKPISILNFLEGTRFSEIKRGAQGAPYRHLLKPKTGGLAFVLEAMGDQFYSLLDVTINYPDGPVSLWGLFSGRLKNVRACVREIAIPQELIGSAPRGDDRAPLQNWIKGIWREKDELLSR